MKAILLGIIGSFFFAFTFILNRSMELSGGSWIWSASLRFIFMLPILLILVAIKGKLAHCFSHLKQNITAYLLWGTIGFGLFYAPITLASQFGEGWLIAGVWQTTIIAGVLLTPIFKQNNNNVHGTSSNKIPFKALGWSLLILLGVFFMQIEHAEQFDIYTSLACLLPMLLAAFMYPLGNRKMMLICRHDVDTFERVLNMTIGSMPFWIILSIVGLFTDGVPSEHQLGQSFLVALFSGVIGTLFFFAATNLVKYNNHKLASVEATQSGEVIFALLGEIIYLHAAVPAPLSLIGLGLIIIGMILHCLKPNPL